MKRRAVFVLLAILSTGLFAVAQSNWVDANQGFEIGYIPFAFGSWNLSNAFLGFSGNTTMSGPANAGLGMQALAQNRNGAYNTAVGFYAMYANLGGVYNTGSGAFALRDNTSGNYNTAAGFGSLYSNTTSSQNTAFGFESLFSNSAGFQNTAVGASALEYNTSGYYNTSTGAGALTANTNGSWNTAAGAWALTTSTTGNFNVANGTYALYRNTSGGGNTADGAEALFYNTTGAYNTALGYLAGPDSASPGLTNATAIGANAVVSESNALVLGGSGFYAVKVGIGTATPTSVFTIAQGAGVAISDGWTTYSSRRWKTNILTLHDALAKVEQLRGVSYDLKDSGKHEVGVIAEEVGAVVPEIVSWDKNGKNAQGVDYSRLTALLIEATKEQQILIQKQQTQINTQQVQIARLASQVRSVQAALKITSRTRPAVRTLQARQGRATTAFDAQ